MSFFFANYELFYLRVIDEMSRMLLFIIEIEIKDMVTEVT